jgi:hypothetical protein
MKMSAKLLSAAFLVTTVCGIAPSYGQTFSVCEGEYERRCPPHEGYTYCGTIDGFATNLCQQSGATGDFTKVKLTDIGGNKCGYAMWRVTCK